MKTEVLYLDANDVKVKEGFNVRYDFGDMNQLTSSIKENGVKIPLRGYKEYNDYIITDGHRRFKAIKNLDKQGVIVKVPLVLERSGYNNEIRTLDLIIANEGKKLTLLEEAEVYGRLVSYGWSVSEIALKVAKSITHVSNCMLLVSASKELKKKIQLEKVSASTVIEMLKKEASDKVSDKIEKASEKTQGKKVTGRYIDKKLNNGKDVITDLRVLRNTFKSILKDKTKSNKKSKDRDVKIYTFSFTILDKIIAYSQEKISFDELSKLFFEDVIIEKEEEEKPLTLV